MVRFLGNMNPPIRLRSGTDPTPNPAWDNPGSKE